MATELITPRGIQSSCRVRSESSSVVGNTGETGRTNDARNYVYTRNSSMVTMIFLFLVIGLVTIITSRNNSSRWWFVNSLSLRNHNNNDNNKRGNTLRRRRPSSSSSLSLSSWRRRSISRKFEPLQQYSQHNEDDDDDNTIHNPVDGEEKKTSTRRNNPQPPKPKKPRRPRIPTTADRRWEVRPIGYVESPYQTKVGMPRQATVSLNDGGAQHGVIHLFEEEFGAGKKGGGCCDGLEEFDFIWCIALLHTNTGYKATISPSPRPDTTTSSTTSSSNNTSVHNNTNTTAMVVPDSVGLFASRAPHRPNPIAISCLKVTRVDAVRGKIYVYGLDLLHDTPVLDIKPYCPAFDAFPTARSGWMDTIYEDPLLGRARGYQSIASKRGIRQARNRNSTSRSTSTNTSNGDVNSNSNKKNNNSNITDNTSAAMNDDTATPDDK